MCKPSQLDRPSAAIRGGFAYTLTHDLLTGVSQPLHGQTLPVPTGETSAGREDLGTTSGLMKASIHEVLLHRSNYREV